MADIDAGAHRRALLERLAEENAACLVFSGSPAFRNADSEYRFRPTSDFLYLTGFTEPDTALLLVPNGEEAKSILFLRERDPKAEVWTGRRLGVERAVEALGVDDARPVDALFEDLPKLLAGHEALVYESDGGGARDRDVLDALARARSARRRGEASPSAWIEPEATLHELRLRKDEAELEAMRRAAALTTDAHRAAMRAAKPGMLEMELEARIEFECRSKGSTGPAYTTIVAGGANACILHYVENDARLEDGDLVLIDAGYEWNYHASDVTRTFPVNGRFSPEQRTLYDLVLAAQHAAIARCHVGSSFDDVHDAALDVLVDGLIEHGLLGGTREEAIESESYRRFYMHRTSHWIGLDVHDCGAYYRDGESRPLEPGMVLTVEPGLYVAEDDDTVEERWRGIGIRIEDDVHVTGGDPEVLTAAVPTDPDEIEALMA
ncbi:MAG TPA: M24 family metallopeptidase [Planctomycetes bacterium]|nr:M24 family metallopeptidase [Planctomycetota bacterium]